MQDQKKTKAQLIEELQHLRTRLEDADHGENGSATESDIRTGPWSRSHTVRLAFCRFHDS